MRKYRCIQQHHGNVLDFIDFFSKVLKFQKFRDLNVLVADWLDTYTWDMKRFVILKNVQRLTFKLFGLDIPDIFPLVSKEVVIINNFAGKLFGNLCKK